MKRAIDTVDKIENPKGDDIIILNMVNKEQHLIFGISCKTPLNEALKKFVKMMRNLRCTGSLFSQMCRSLC